MDIVAYKKQVRTRTTDRLLPCGICHTEFEVNDICALSKHLRDHFENFNGKHWCSICEVSFVHETDYKRHEMNAAAGNCGFAFVHTAPCTGHHRPDRREIVSIGPRSNEDRFNFAYRLRTWEQSQLRLFLSSLKPLAQSTQDGTRMWSDIAGGTRVVAHSTQDRARIWSDIAGGTQLTGRNCTARVESLVYPPPHPQVKLTSWRASEAGQSELGDLSGTPTILKPLDLHNSTMMTPFEAEADEEFVSESLGGMYADHFTQRLLHQSIVAQDVDMLAFALACGADVDGVNEAGQSPLHVAASQGAVGSTHMLLEAGANVSVCDGSGEPPLVHAVIQGHRNVAEILVDYGAIEESIKNGQAVIHAAFAPTIPSRRDFGREMPLDFDKLDPWSKYVWHRLQFLVENGAAVVAPDKQNRTALERAAELGHFLAAKLLLDHGAMVPLDRRVKKDALLNAILHRHS